MSTQASYRSRLALDPSIAKEVYYVFLPEPRSKIVRPVYKPTCFPQRITRCYSWVFTKLDLRASRKSLCGAGCMRNVATNVCGRCALLTDHKAKVENSFTPAVEDHCEEGGDPGASDDEANAPMPMESITHQTKAWGGWKLAYRMQEPDRDDKSVEASLKALQQKGEAIGGALARYPAERHRPRQEIINSQIRSNKRKGEHDARVRAAMSSRGGIV